MKACIEQIRETACVTLSLKEVEDIDQATWIVTIEYEGGDKPVFVAESIAWRYD